MDIISRYKGCLFGLAVGDALGTSLEFKEPGSFEPIHDMTGGGPFELKPGQWTDDTSMALCLAESLIICNGMNLVDQLERYTRWFDSGHLSSTGKCFDIGNTVRLALNNFSVNKSPFSGPTDEFSAGNGSLMRLAPVPLFYANSPIQAVEMSGLSSKTTHGNRKAVDACRYFGGLIVSAVKGFSKEEILSTSYHSIKKTWNEFNFINEILEIAGGSFKHKNPPEIKGTGYVVKSLEAALWAFYNSSDFEEGCLLAVNLGDDADTTGAIFGQLAGAYYGIEGIPYNWLSKIYKSEIIEEFALKIYDLSKSDT